MKSPFQGTVFGIVTRRKSGVLGSTELPTCVATMSGLGGKCKVHALSDVQQDFDFRFFGIPTKYVPADLNVEIGFWHKGATDSSLLPAHLYKWTTYKSLGEVPPETPQWMRLVVKKNDIRVLKKVPTAFVKLTPGDAVLMQYGGGEDAYAQCIRAYADAVGAKVYRTPPLSREFRKRFSDVVPVEGVVDVPPEAEDGEDAAAANAVSVKREAEFLAGELRKFLAGESAEIPIYEMLEGEALVEQITYLIGEYTATQVERIKRGNGLFAMTKRRMFMAGEYRLIEDEFEERKAADVTHGNYLMRETELLHDLEKAVKQHPFHAVLKADEELSRGIGPVIMGGIIAMTGGNISRFDLPDGVDRTAKIAAAKARRDECLRQVCGEETLSRRLQREMGAESHPNFEWIEADGDVRVMVREEEGGALKPMGVARRLSHLIRCLAEQEESHPDLPMLIEARKFARRVNKLRSRKRAIVRRMESNVGLKCLGADVPAHERWPRTMPFVRRFWKTVYYLMDQIQRGTNVRYRAMMDTQFEVLKTRYPEQVTVQVKGRDGKLRSRKMYHEPHLKRMARRFAVIRMMRKIFNMMVDTLLPEAAAVDTEA